MKYVTIEIPEPLYNAAKEVTRQEHIRLDQYEIERLVRVTVERVLFNDIDETLKKVLLADISSKRESYEKAFEYMREYVEGYWKRLEELKRELQEKYLKKQDK